MRDKNMLERPALHPSIALAAYAESLVDGQRVVVFGDATSSLPEQLLERGARLVHVYDSDPTRAAEAAARNRSQNLWFAPLSDGELALRERSFDLALVENLASHVEPASLLKRIRRTLTGRGAAIVACPNPDVRLRLLSDPNSTSKALDYYALYDAVAELFPHVRMLGQMPFVGYALADFGTEREPEPTIDSGFVPGGAEEPEWFIALASEHQTRLDEFAVVQLPFRAALGSTKIVVLEQQLRASVAAERRSRERLAELEAQPARTGDARMRPVRLPEPADVVELRRELERREAWIKGLEARATAADERADTTQAELEEERTQNADLRQQLEAAQARGAELERTSAPAEQPAERPDETASASAAAFASAAAAAAQATEQLAESEQRAAELELRASKAEEQITLLRSKVAELTRTDEDGTTNEIFRLEAQLAERGGEVRRLERELREAERIGKELVRELSALPSAADREPSPAADDAAQALADLRLKLDALAALNAEREADLTAARWAIQALEARLEDSAGSDAPPPHGAPQAQANPSGEGVELEAQVGERLGGVIGRG
jgi:SAM-dependent methyltransferase